MNYIVLDLEWNQPRYEQERITSPCSLSGEIIQIGAVKLDETYQVLDTFKILVRPIRYKKMHRKVSKLTKIKTEDLKQGILFQQALKYFKKWCGKDAIFLTWGPDDIQILKENLELYAMNTAWLPKSYDLQVIFDSQITKEGRQVSLLNAMDKVGESPREAHDALNDAWNTVCVCLHLDMVRGLSEYEQLPKLTTYCGKTSCEDKSFVKVRSAHKTLKKEYSTKTEALCDQDVIQFDCPHCGQRVTCTGIVKQTTDKSIALGKCENGEELFVRFKFIRNDGKLSVNRILYELDEEYRNYYSARKQRAEELEVEYLRRIGACV